MAFNRSASHIKDGATDIIEDNSKSETSLVLPFAGNTLGLLLRQPMGKA